MEETRGVAPKTTSSSSLYPLPSPPVDPSRRPEMLTGVGMYRQHHHQRRRHSRNDIHKPECTCFRHLTANLCGILLNKNPSSKKKLNGGSQPQENAQELSFMSHSVVEDATKPNNSSFYRIGKDKKRSKFKITCCCVTEPSRMSSVAPRNLTTGARPPSTAAVRQPVRNASMETMVSSRNIDRFVVEQPTGSDSSIESIHIELMPNHEQELVHEEEPRGTARKSVRNSVRSSVRSSKEAAETDESDLRDSSDYVEIIDRQESEDDDDDDDEEEEGEFEILSEEAEREEEAERKERKFWAGRYDDAVEIVEEEKNEVKKERKLAEKKVDEVVERFTESGEQGADELYMHDIVGSRAHVKMLAAMVSLIGV